MEWLKSTEVLWMGDEISANNMPSEGIPEELSSEVEMGSRRPCPKPMLSIAQQIDHMKSKGITFTLCSEGEAASYLADRTYFFKLYAYRSLFERRVGGGRDGQYVGLDFGHLKLLSSLDRSLRYALLPMALDVEHFSRVKLINEVVERDDEDGYSVISDYFSSLNHADRRRRMGEINGFLKDVYSGDLAQKYTLPDAMPLWVYLEMASFGTFVDLWLFCANRWGVRSMVDGHYQLRQTKLIRNACAHSSNVINGFAREIGSVSANVEVMRAVARTGISHRVRTAKMANPRLQQIVTLLYLHVKIVPEGSAMERARGDVSQLSLQMKDALKALSGNDAIRSSFGFLMALFDKWF